MTYGVTIEPSWTAGVGRFAQAIVTQGKLTAEPADVESACSDLSVLRLDGAPGDAAPLRCALQARTHPRRLATRGGRNRAAALQRRGRPCGVAGHDDIWLRSGQSRKPWPWLWGWGCGT